MTTSFRAGKLDPPAPQTIEPSAFHIYVSEAIYRFRGGKLSLDAFIQLQTELPLPMTAFRELWRGDTEGSKTRHLVNVIWNAFKGTPAIVEDIATLVTHPRADPSAGSIRNRHALLVAVLETLEGTTLPGHGDMPPVEVRKRVGIKDGKHVAFWLIRTSRES